MRFSYLLISLLLSPLCAFGNLPLDTPKNAIVKQYSNEMDPANRPRGVVLKRDYPTQILRMSSPIDGIQLTCDQVIQEITNTIFKKLPSDKFIYNAYVWCKPNAETNFAEAFSINGYLDPISDAGIDYLNQYLEKYNGSDFLSTQLKFEPAKAVIVTIHIAAGMREKPGKPPSTEYINDHSTFYFKNNFEVRYQLIEDIAQHFFSNEPEKLLPFLNRWVNAYADKIYKKILVNSNYLDFKPDRIFLMEEGEPIFMPMIKFHYNHDCHTHFEDHRCLKNT